jgi:hypothetical protein
VGRSYERSRSGFSTGLTNSAMVKAMFQGDVFLSKENSIQVKAGIDAEKI